MAIRHETPCGCRVVLYGPTRDDLVDAANEIDRGLESRGEPQGDVVEVPVPDGPVVVTGPRAPCAHSRREDWDCGCSHGCGACACTSKCLDCGQPLAGKPARPVAYQELNFPSIGALARHLRGYEEGRVTKRQRNYALDRLREDAKAGG
jgi:hypothetical protein